MTKVLALLSAALLIAGCGPRDRDYEEIANTALDQANLESVDVDYDEGQRVVHVTGTVPTEADRQRVEDVVQAAINNEAQVANEVTVAGGHTEAADDLDGGLETRLGNLMEADATLRDRDITFDANNGVVTISGNVPTEAEKQRVEQMTRNQPGVTDVVNSLMVEPATR
jgi:osmotically-inducible protein OsmY